MLTTNGTTFLEGSIHPLYKLSSQEIYTFGLKALGRTPDEFPRYVKYWPPQKLVSMPLRLENRQ